MMKHPATVAGGGPSVSAPVRIRLAICLAALLGLAAVAGSETTSQRHPAGPGRLSIEGVSDPSGLAPVVDAADGTRNWSWSWGALTVSADSVDVDVGASGLALSYGSDLCGVSRGRRLRFVEGTYPVDGPLLLRCAAFQLFVDSGELEIGEGRLVLAVREDKPPPGAQYLLFIGVLMLTTFMMIKLRKRRGTS